ncbi:MAG: choice-of-anchor Q domain-containing protein [Fibrobacteria bacterium]
MIKGRFTALVLMAALPAMAASYFVDSQNGSDLATGQTADLAWKSLAQANKAALKPGDSLQFKCGGAWTGQLNLKIAGAENNPIVVTDYGTGARPVFENPAAGTANAINLSAGWIRVENLLVRNVFQVGINISSGADHIGLSNLEITDCGIGVNMTGRYGLVTKSHFHDLHIVVNTPKSLNDNDDYGAVGVVLSNSDNEVAFCRFIRCVAPSADYGVDGGAVEIWADKDIRNIYIHHNSAYRCSGFFEIGGKGFAVEAVRVAYNELADCFGLSFLFVNNSGDYTVKLTDYRFENNTLVVHDCPGEKIWTCIAWQAASPPGVFTMRNNLFYVHNADRILWNVTAPVEDHNLVFHLGTAFFDKNFTASAQDIIGKDPLLTSPGTCAENGDYRIKAGSPAIDAGAALGYAADLAGISVPNGSSPDIGAYEFSGGLTGLRSGRSFTEETGWSRIGPGNGSRQGIFWRNGSESTDGSDASGRRIH